jgi:hypothetical protein
MANDPQFKMSFQDASGSYYIADQQPDGTYSITNSGAVQYLKVLPEGWEQTSVTWERDMYYMGVFRSMSSNSAYSFSMDARAIIKHIAALQGIQGYCLFKIWMINDQWGYDVFYKSELDFKTYKDNIQDELLKIHTLDNGLIRDIHAYGDTQYNIPVWQNSGTGWITDADILVHGGIKLLYSSTYSSSATPTDTLRVDLWGFNVGQFGTFPNAGTHFIPSMFQQDITQANGATTYIGNNILQKFIIPNNQSYKQYEVKFNEGSRPYSTKNNLLLNILQNGASYIDTKVTLNYEFDPSLYTVGIVADYSLIFALFEVDKDDNPLISGGRYLYTPIASVLLTDSGGSPLPLPTGAQTATISVNAPYDKCFMLCIISDTPVGYSTDPTISLPTVSVRFSTINITIASNYDSGVSGVPIIAPSFPASSFPIFRLKQLLQKIVPYLATTQTDSFGFPIPVTTPYTGISGFLDAANTTAVGDVVPYQIGWTSAYCMHNLEGQSYMTVSLNQLFDVCKKILGAGASLEYDPSGDPNYFRIEELAYYFDSSTMILDLGEDIVDFEIEYMTEGFGANMKLGYEKGNNKSYFGVDAFNSQNFYNTPLSNIKGDMDIQLSGVMTDQYAIEDLRRQRVSQPIGATYDPASPSTDNKSAIFYCTATPTIVVPSVLPQYANATPYDPDNTPYTATAYTLTQRSNAQSTDHTAASAPYIYGMYYPDTAYNVELSPCRILERGQGRMLRSVLDKMDSKYLTFRNTYIMQYNNSPTASTGISSNLQVGAGATAITEFEDKLIGDLPNQLFKPVLFHVRSQYPVNMYQLVNSNPRGYVRFVVKGRHYDSKVYKGFIQKITQAAGNSEPTAFVLIATPDFVL